MRLIVLLVTLATAAGASPPLHESKVELFVTNTEESVRFYRALGFHVAHQKEGGYTTLDNGAAVIALSPLPAWLPLHWLGFLRHPPLGTELVFYTARLEAMRTELADAGYEPGPIELQSWGDRDFRVTDCDGYYIRISEGVAVPASPPSRTATSAP